jgi:hypothetical protein
MGDKDTRSYLKKLTRKYPQLEVRQLRSNAHFEIYDSQREARVAIVAGSASDWRALKNLTAHITREGYPL